MCGTEQPQTGGNGGSNPMAVNHLLILFFYWIHMFSLSFSFGNVYYFTWLASFGLIFLQTSSNVFAPLFLSKMNQK